MEKKGSIQNEAAIYEQLARMTRENMPGVLATVIGTELSTPRNAGSKMIIMPDGSITGSVGGGRAEAVVMVQAKQVLADGQCRTVELDLDGKLGVCGGNMHVFMEPVLRTVPFVVVGAGHVGRAVVEMGQNLGLHLVLVDDRQEFLDPVGEQGIAQCQTAGPEDIAENLTIDPRGGILLASRAHDLDARYLEAVMKLEQSSGLEFGFLGVLGSRGKIAQLREKTAALGADFEKRLATIQAPVGIDIGSESPHEIALSILAEVLAVLRGVPYLKNDAGQEMGLRLQRRRGDGELS